MALAASLVEFDFDAHLAEEVTILPMIVPRFRKQSSHLLLGKKKEELSVKID